jgi:hypothetical protein
LSLPAPAALALTAPAAATPVTITTTATLPTTTRTTTTTPLSLYTKEKSLRSVSLLFCPLLVHPFLHIDSLCSAWSKGLCDCLTSDKGMRRLPCSAFPSLLSLTLLFSDRYVLLSLHPYGGRRSEVGWLQCLCVLLLLYLLPALFGLLLTLFRPPILRDRGQ